MNKKIKFSSLLKNASNLTDIFDFYKKNFPKKKFLFSKVKDTWNGNCLLYTSDAADES